MTAAMGPKVKGDAVASAPVPVATTDERRRSPRVLVDLEVDCASEDNYLFAYITDISATGIFVRTTTPEQPGTHLTLRLSSEPGPDARTTVPPPPSPPPPDGFNTISSPLNPRL